MRIGGSRAPSSARNRPAGKRDTTGRLHYRAPTCFLSPHRGLSPPACARALLGRVAACRCPPSLARATSRFFCPTGYIQIRFVDSLCSAWVTGPDPLSLPLSLCRLRTPARFSVKRGRSHARRNHRISSVKRREQPTSKFRAVKRCSLEDEDAVALGLCFAIPAPFYGDGVRAPLIKTCSFPL